MTDDDTEHLDFGNIAERLECLQHLAAALEMAVAGSKSLNRDEKDALYQPGGTTRHRAGDAQGDRRHSKQERSQ